MDKLDDLLKQLAALSRQRPSGTDLGRLNKVKELLGEAGARAEVAKKFGAGRVTHVGAPRRGPKGAPILDLLYELDSGELVLVEAKYGESLLGRTVDRHVYVVGVSEGKAVRTPLPLKRQVTQLDAHWVEDRIAEIERTDPALAERLRNAVKNKQLRVLEVRSKANQSGTGLINEIIDHTDKLRAQTQSGWRIHDDERRYARRESLGAPHLKTLKAQAKLDAELAQQANEKLKRAYKAVARAAKDLDAAERPTTKAKRLAILMERQKAVDGLKIAADSAQAIAKKSDEGRELATKLQQRDTLARESAEATKRLEHFQKLEASRAARGKPVASLMLKEAGASVETAVAETRAVTAVSAQEAVAGRLTENRLGAPVVRDAIARAGGREVLAGAAELTAKTTRARAVLEFAGKGLRLTVKVGRIAFFILDLANPVFDLLQAVELVDSLVDWLRRHKIREEQEWLRLNDFLVGEENRIVSPHGIAYRTSIRSLVNAFLELKLADPSYNRSFPYWFAQWSAMPRTFNGFVYTQIDVDLERQQENRDVPYSVKYYASNVHIAFTHLPEPNLRVVTSSVGMVGPSDERNRSTGGGDARSDPDRNIAVDIGFQKVRYTPPQPTLTPFDFLIVACRNLAAQVVTFLSRFDPRIFDGMEIRTELIDAGDLFRGEKVYWLEGQAFPAPLKSDEVHFCLKTIFWVIDKLETHALRDGDFKRKERADRFNVGAYRRLQILRVLTSPDGGLKGAARYRVRPMHDVAVHLRRIVTSYDQAAKEDIEYLMEAATRVDEDLRQTLKECQSSPSTVEYNYQGKMFGKTN